MCKLGWKSLTKERNSLAEELSSGIRCIHVLIGRLIHAPLSTPTHGMKIFHSILLPNVFFLPDTAFSDSSQLGKGFIGIWQTTLNKLHPTSSGCSSLNKGEFHAFINDTITPVQRKRVEPLLHSYVVCMCCICLHAFSAVL